MSTDIEVTEVVNQVVEKEIIRWPSSLVAELAERRCIIVLGSGVSASSKSSVGKSPKDWDGFLREGIKRMNNEDAKVVATELCNKKNYLDAAQIMKDHINLGDYDDFFQEEFNPRDIYQPSAIHKTIMLLDPKVVVTTNYDKIYDNLCMQQPSYNVLKYYDNNIIDDIRSRKRLVLKAHGCVSNTKQTILTRGDYFEARDKYSSFYRVLDSLFLVNTLLFIGNGLSDPDINLLLENANIAAKCSRPHYILSGDNWNMSVKKAIKSTYNLEFLEYPAGQYDLIPEALNDLLSLVLEHRNENGLQ
ncbi:SIR2 family protein [Paenibacillus sp. H1-7]|uniref:SIR2 family protein n=1 Tax=Paenibacillus sp. H1-7 TaxID=2282849 RepID=UPI001EF8E852|nr:SIR2 family protein [Paenibacillus sp. H1-7]ULL13087.1 SIR2 family protein [Paenibacillus sp. H1-7]